MRCGTEVVGVNIAERVNHRIWDTFSMWFPQYSERGPIGKLLINANIREAIRTQATWYEFGCAYFGESRRYPYKYRWCPKTWTFPTMRNFAVLRAATIADGDFQPPYFNLDRQQMEMTHAVGA